MLYNQKILCFTIAKTATLIIKQLKRIIQTPATEGA